MAVFVNSTVYWGIMYQASSKGPIPPYMFARIGPLQLRITQPLLFLLLLFLLPLLAVLVVVQARGGDPQIHRLNRHDLNRAELSPWLHTVSGPPHPPPPGLMFMWYIWHTSTVPSKPISCISLCLTHTHRISPCVSQIYSLSVYVHHIYTLCLS